jgi:hypothetical protein
MGPPRAKFGPDSSVNPKQRYVISFNPDLKLNLPLVVLVRIAIQFMEGSLSNSISARGWLVLVTVSMDLYLPLPDHGLAQNNQGQNDQGIKLAVLNGTYSVHITGYVPDSSGNKVPLALAGRVTHFANGTNGTLNDSPETAIDRAMELSNHPTIDLLTVNRSSLGHRRSPVHDDG